MLQFSNTSPDEDDILNWNQSDMKRPEVSKRKAKETPPALTTSLGSRCNDRAFAKADDEQFDIMSASKYLPRMKTETKLKTAVTLPIIGAPRKIQVSSWTTRDNKRQTS